MRMSLIVATVLAVTAPSEDQGLAGLAGQAQLSPEQQQSLDAARRQQEEALKKMTPEQRRCYEEMMKSIQGAGADPRGS